MTDAKAIPVKTKSEASQAIANLKVAGYKNVALIGPVTSVDTLRLAGANWLVVATDAVITIK